MTTIRIMSAALLASLIFSTHATELPKLCPYTDNFSVQAPDGFKITNIDAIGNIAIVQQGPVHFTTGCRSNKAKNNGWAFITVSNGSSQCVIKLKDGPLMMRPNIEESNCEGELQYNSMEHRVGSYYYKIIFTTHS